jgi:hypothetical protein
MKNITNNNNNRKRFRNPKEICPALKEILKNNRWVNLVDKTYRIARLL